MTNSGAGQPRPPTDRERDRPVLPDTTRDEDDHGWGDRNDEDNREEWYRRERPPHHE